MTAEFHSAWNWCRRLSSTWRRRTVVCLVVVFLVAAGGVGTAQSQQGATSPSITITLKANGSAQWTVVNTVELPSETARNAFNQMAGNETRREAILAESITSYRAVANQSSDMLGRSMSVEANSISLRREGATGVITVRFTWTGFARTEDDKVVVGDVFAGGFPLSTNRSLTIEGPDEYRLASHNVSTETASIDGATVTWTGPTTVRSSINLTYEPSATPTHTGTETATATPTESPETSTQTVTGETDTPGSSGPGFGFVSVFIAMIGLIMVRHGLQD